MRRVGHGVAAAKRIVAQARKSRLFRKSRARVVDVSNSSSRNKVPARTPGEPPSETISAPSALITRCVLFARVTAGANGLGAVADPEQVHAIQRCLKRMRRAAEAFGGRTFKPGEDGVLALFVNADSALQAACELHQRVGDLPPSAGIKLSTRTGLDFGTVVADEDQAFGECVDRAHALARLAKADQILATGEMIQKLSSSFSVLGHARGSMEIVRDCPPVPVFEFHRTEIGHAAASPPASPSRTQRQHLMLTLGGDTVTVDSRRGVRTLGRDIGNDMSVNEPRASRTHARIEQRGSTFVLVDVSRNGTFVQLDSGRQIVLRQEEMELPEQGQISLGRPCAADAPCVSFEIVRD